MEIETIRVRANGLDFAVDRCGAGEKFALLLHGFPESRFSWRHQLPALAAAGYTAWAPDLRGYGQSSRPAGVAAYALPNLVADVSGLIDAARVAGIAGPLTLVAHDWGGAIAWAFVLRPPRPVARFVVMNLPHPAKFAAGLRTLRQLRRSWYIAFFQLPWLPERMLAANRARAIARMFRGMAVDKSRFPPAVLDVYRQNALEAGALTAMLNYYRAFLRHPPRTSGYTAVETPTLMIWGEADSALGIELTHGTAALVRDFTLHTLPRVSHWVQQEAPEAVNAAMLGWLAQSRP